MCSQLTLGSTQPGDKPVTVDSGDASSSWQHSIKGHATEEKERDDYRQCYQTDGKQAASKEGMI